MDADGKFIITWKCEEPALKSQLETWCVPTISIQVIREYINVEERFPLEMLGGNACRLFRSPKQHHVDINTVRNMILIVGGVSVNGGNVC